MDENTDVQRVALQVAVAVDSQLLSLHIFTSPSRPGSVAQRALLVGSWNQFHFENLEIGLSFFFLLGNEPCIPLKMMSVSGEGAVRCL